jgi:hypothetical protein
VALKQLHHSSPVTVLTFMAQGGLDFAYDTLPRCGAGHCIVKEALLEKGLIHFPLSVFRASGVCAFHVQWRPVIACPRSSCARGDSKTLVSGLKSGIMCVACQRKMVMHRSRCSVQRAWSGTPLQTLTTSSGAFTSTAPLTEGRLVCTTLHSKVL